MLVVACTCELLITRNFTDSLRKSVTWQVADYEKNPFRSWTREEVQHFLGTRKDLHFRRPLPAQTPAKVSVLPTNFDARTQWGACIHPVRDQGNCGSCWAFGATGFLSDRFCIRGKDVILSPQYVIECDTRDYCCDGGALSTTMNFLTKSGTVPDSCLLYDQNCAGCRSPSCSHYYCKSRTTWTSTNVATIQNEIYTNGPVEGAFDVYEDFMYYTSGVYYHALGGYMGGHAIEVVGWGYETGLNYWLCKNSWGIGWGLSGYFKIMMGDSDINNNMIACQPLV